MFKCVDGVVDALVVGVVDVGVVEGDVVGVVCSQLANVPSVNDANILFATFAAASQLSLRIAIMLLICSCTAKTPGYRTYSPSAWTKSELAVAPAELSATICTSPPFR